MQQFLSDMETFLTPFWKRIQPHIQPLIDYLKKGTIGSALFLLFMGIFMIWGLVWGITPMLFSNLMPPIELSGEDLADLRPGKWQRYTIETDGAYPIGIRSWWEQREYGVITTYRSDDSYWGVYVVDDYFIYFDSAGEYDLERPPETLTGRLGRLDRDTQRQLNNLIPDKPDTVLSLKYHEQSFAEDVSGSITTIILGAMLFGMAWFFHNEAIKRNNGQAPSDAFKKLVKALEPITKHIYRLIDWIWDKLKGLFSAGLQSIVASFIKNYQDEQGAGKSSKRNDNERVITIDPSKVRHIDDE